MGPHDFRKQLLVPCRETPSFLPKIQQAFEVIDQGCRNKVNDRLPQRVLAVECVDSAWSRCRSTCDVTCAIWHCRDGGLMDSPSLCGPSNSNLLCAAARRAEGFLVGERPRSALG